MMKLAVGVPSLEAFESRIEARRVSGTGMQVWTRSFPKRADDVIGTGSLFWVVAGLLSARQPIITIEEDTYDDGSRCARIELEPILDPRVSRSDAAIPGLALSRSGGSANRPSPNEHDRTVRLAAGSAA